MSSPIFAAKKLLRKEIKIMLKSLSNFEKSRQSSLVTEMLLKSPQYVSCKRISIYLSMPDEIDTSEILKDIFKSGKSCYIPRYIGEKMSMVRLHSLQDYESLPVTSWNIKQPSGDEIREDCLDTVENIAGGLDVVLIPGLGFTKDGDRLGRGKAYYDSFLSNYEIKMNKKVVTVALAFKEQIHSFIPTTDSDQKIDLVLFHSS